MWMAVWPCNVERRSVSEAPRRDKFGGVLVNEYSGKSGENVLTKEDCDRKEFLLNKICDVEFVIGEVHPYEMLIK